MKMLITIPEDIKFVMAQLTTNDYQVFAVGGCVRDTLLDLEPKDWDLTTNAKPDEIKEIFKDQVCHTAGEKFGMIAVYSFTHDRIIEITTFRSDYNTNGRHTDVQYVSSPYEDSMRRDLTINALYADIRGLVFNYHTGLFDLNHKIIRTVGLAYDRFQEDYLRMLRAIRFTARFDFILDPEVFDTIKLLAENINRISAERIQVELKTMLKGPNPVKAISLLEQTKLLKYILPELFLCVDYNHFNPHHDLDLFKHQLATMKKMNEFYQKSQVSESSIMAALIHDIGKIFTQTFNDQGYANYYDHDLAGLPIIDNLLKRLHYSNAERNHILTIVKYHLWPHWMINDFKKNNKFNIKSLRKFTKNVLSEYTTKEDESYKKQAIQDIILHALADDSNKPDKDNSRKYFVLNDLSRTLQSTIPVQPKPILNGYDLMELGFKGPEIGFLTKELLIYQDKIYPEVLTKDQAKKWLHDERIITYYYQQVGESNHE